MRKCICLKAKEAIQGPRRLPKSPGAQESYLTVFPAECAESTLLLQRIYGWMLRKSIIVGNQIINSSSSVIMLPVCWNSQFRKGEAAYSSDWGRIASGDQNILR